MSRPASEQPRSYASSALTNKFGAGSTEGEARVTAAHTNTSYSSGYDESSDVQQVLGQRIAVLTRGFFSGAPREEDV